MRIIRDLEQLKQPLPGAVVTIGNFDGVHLGHREIFRRVLQGARRIGGTATVLTFHPHPLKVLAPARAPAMINTPEEKERLIAASCIDVLICLPFDAALAAIPAERFLADILVSRIGLRHLVVGYDYAFGRGREGDIAFLRERAERFGYALEVLPPVAAGTETYSSTRIRELIGKGRMAEVMTALGRHFSLAGTVVRGVGRGRRLGFPTANLRTDKELLPPPGVYAVKVRLERRLLDGVANIGFNPTFGPGAFSVEVHLLDFSGDLYDRSLRVFFIERLRDEMAFPEVSALTAAIAGDIRRARPLLKATRLREYRETFECASRTDDSDGS